MSNEIKVTTGDLKNHAASISNLAILVGDISRNNTNAINKMENACSCFRAAGIYVSANELIGKFTDLVNTLNAGASKALACAEAYEDSSDSLINQYKDWFENVEAGSATNSVLSYQSGAPIELDYYLNKVTDAEYAKLNQIWTDVCDSDDPINEFIKRLPENSPLRKISADQINVIRSDSGLDAITLTDNNGNALVIFAGTKDFKDMINDASILRGHAPEQEYQAIALINQLAQTHPNITVSGYSLGGYLATAATLKCPSITKCVTFDPPGRYDKFFQDIFNSDACSKITTYEANGSLVSAVGLSEGKWTPVSVEYNTDCFFPNHNIEKIYEALGGDNAVNNCWNQGAADLVTGNYMA